MHFGGILKTYHIGYVVKMTTYVITLMIIGCHFDKKNVLAWKPARFHKRSNHWLTVSSRSDRILQTIWVNGVAREPSDPGPDSTNDPITDRISIFSLSHGFSIRSDSTNELGVARIVIPAYVRWIGPVTLLRPCLIRPKPDLDFKIQIPKPWGCKQTECWIRIRFLENKCKIWI